MSAAVHASTVACVAYLVLSRIAGGGLSLCAIWTSMVSGRSGCPLATGNRRISLSTLRTQTRAISNSEAGISTTSAEKGPPNDEG